MTPISTVIRTAADTAQPRSSVSSRAVKTPLLTAALFALSFPALASDPGEPASTGSGVSIAIAVEGATGELADEIEGAARDSLHGNDLVDAGAVRAARSFGAMRGELDDAKAEKLRGELAVDRLVVVHVREDAGKRFLVARAVDAGGITRKYGEARTGELAGSVRELVAQLPAVKNPATTGTRTASLASTRPAAASPASTPRAPVLAGTGPYVNLDALLGQKQLDSDDWRPIGDQLELGVAGTFGGEMWPVQIAGDFYRSAGQDTIRGYDQFGDPVSVDVEGDTTELGFGVRKIFVADALRPHVGAGLAFVSASVRARADNGQSASDSDTAIGPWIAAGAMIRAGSNMNIGLLVRWSSATVDLNGYDGDAGGLHFGVTIGAGFGSASTRR